jgi:hypothetical protein
MQACATRLSAAKPRQYLAPCEARSPQVNIEMLGIATFFPPESSLRASNSVDTLLRDTLLCVVFVNGVYDVVCFLGIMLALPVFGSLHIGVFKPNELSPLAERILAYWILTYGVIRVLVASGDECITGAAALSYFIETFAFECENFTHGSVIRYKVHAMSLASMSIAVLLLTLQP